MRLLAAKQAEFFISPCPHSHTKTYLRTFKNTAARQRRGLGCEPCLKNRLDPTPFRTVFGQKIARTFREEEVYRIDHYLGKPVVRDMLRLRESSPAFEKLLNGNTVERVDIVMREKIGCEGRGGYYNKYGVIRDVLQNHLTEIAALIAADLPAGETRSSSSCKSLNLHLPVWSRAVTRSTLNT